MKVLKRILPFAIIALAVLLLLYSPDIAPERYTDLATFFRVEMKRQGYSGFSVAAVADGSVLYVDGFGKDGSGATIGPDTPLYAPAVAPSLTALSAYSLVRSGRLSLDVPVWNYLPWFGAPGPGVTPRHLISHTSGFPKSAFDDEHPSAPDLETAARSMIGALPSAEPGTSFQYIDTDYQVLALAMEKVEGKPYASILDERIIVPLGMKSTSAHVPSEKPGDRPSSPPSSFAEPRGSASFFSLPLSRASPSPAFAAASGCIVTSASDIGQYMAFLLGPEKFKRGPLSARAVGLLFDPLVPNSPYCYGFFLGKDGDARIAYHEGSLDGFSSRIVLWPDSRTGIAVIAAQNSLLQSLVALPALTDGARRIMREGSSARPFPLGRLYILLSVVAVVQLFALCLQMGGALHWAKEAKDKAEARGSLGPLRFATFRCWLGIAVRGGLALLFPLGLGLVFGKASSWSSFFQLEPGLAAWCLFACLLGVFRNAARVVWLHSALIQRRSR